jgi:hypothetical protein
MKTVPILKKLNLVTEAYIQYTHYDVPIVQSVSAHFTVNFRTKIWAVGNEHSQIVPGSGICTDTFTS